uniref:Uncharacterized protein n=1 Tax=Oryzias latipes TaxID=8090 RepID=A0A3B3H734_ORYLA
MSQRLWVTLTEVNRLSPAMTFSKLYSSGPIRVEGSVHLRTAASFTTSAKRLKPELICKSLDKAGEIKMPAEDDLTVILDPDPIKHISVTTERMIEKHHI